MSESDFTSSFSSFNDDDDDDILLTREQRQHAATEKFSKAQQIKTLLIREPGWYLSEDTTSQLHLISQHKRGPHKTYTAIKELRQVEMDKCAYHYARGDYQTVVHMIETLLAQPQHEATLKAEQRFQFYDILTRSYHHLGQYSLALPILLRATQRRPADICNWLLLASVYYGLNQRDECIYTYQMAVTTCCHHIHAWIGLAEAHRYFASLSHASSSTSLPSFASSSAVSSTSTSSTPTSEAASASPSTSTSTSSSPSFSPSSPTFDLSLAWLCWHHLNEIVREYRYKYDSITAAQSPDTPIKHPFNSLAGFIPVFHLIDNRLQMLDAYKEPVLPQRLETMDQASFDAYLGPCASFINRYVVAPANSHTRVMRWQHHQQHVRPDKAQQRQRDAEMMHNLQNGDISISSDPPLRKPRDRNDPDYEELTLQMGDDDDAFNPMLM